ncbi:MAG: chromate efflux transporter [Rhodomicrobium sp.]|nr:chromate efflux transporter [Rhodomicrobium sp.]
MTQTLTIFLVFFRLGCTCFGGPIAHLGYFRAEFVNRRKWLNDEAYADVVALSQFVPGPASSQTGFALGLLRGGLRGGLAAWLGFTLPSALIMLLAAYGLKYAQSGIAQGLIHGLKLLAVAVVAQAVWSMGRSLCPDLPRAGFAFSIAAVLIAIPNGGLQLAAIALGAVFGLIFLRTGERPRGHSFGLSTGRTPALAAISLFFLLLAGLPLAVAVSQNGVVQLAEAFYRAGALVFGGGHVVLPLLQETVVQPGWVPHGDFLAGYGAAQALPGPLFAIAAFLGAKASIGPGGAIGALVAVIAIFLPGLLLFYGTLPFWDRLRSKQSARGALYGVNAAVVGILGAAFYQPIWTSTILKPLDAALALLAFAALTVVRLPVLAVAALLAAAGAGLAIF